MVYMLRFCAFRFLSLYQAETGLKKLLFSVRIQGFN